MAQIKPDSLSDKEWERIPTHLRGIHHKEMHICPEIESHNYGPEGYGNWMEWAAKMQKTHHQKECICGFFVIWNKKR